MQNNTCTESSPLVFPQRYLGWWVSAQAAEEAVAQGLAAAATVAPLGCTEVRSILSVSKCDRAPEAFWLRYRKGSSAENVQLRALDRPRDVWVEGLNLFMAELRAWDMRKVIMVSRFGTRRR